MSNGRREGHYGSYSTYNAYHPQQQQQQQSQQSGRRNSFESGDDLHFGGGNNQAPQQGTYQAYGQNQQYPNQSPDLRTQGYGGYPSPPQQYNPSSPSTYNPASYAQQSPQLSSGSHVQMPAGNYAAAVPYNPASYQNPSPQPSQGGFGYQAYGSASVPSYGQNSNPPLPPKPPELVQSPTTQYPSHSPNISYSAYTPPAPPRPPSHGSVGSSPNIPQYQAYSPPQSQHAGPPPPQHRRLPSIPQGAVSPPLDGNSWTPPRGASLNASQGGANAANSGASNSSARPLPPHPSGGFAQTNGSTPGENSGYDAIFAEVEAAVMGRPGSIGHSASQTNHIAQGTVNGVAGQFPSRTSSAGHGHDYFPDTSSGAGNTAADMERMRISEEEEANVARNTSYRSTATTAVPPDGTDVSRNTSYRSTNTVDSNTTMIPGRHDVQDDESDDGVPIDISMGFDPGMNFSYGGNDFAPPTILTPPIQSPPSNAAQSPPPPPLPHRNSSGSVQQQTVQYVWAHSGEALNSPRTAARVDQGITGGNMAPGERRMSFDEDDEATMVGYEQHQASGSSSPVKGGSGIRRAGSRPLPQPPQDQNRLSPNLTRDRYPQGPDHYDSSHEGPENVRKTNSLNYTNHNHHHNNQHLVPGRSITDAEQRRKQGVRSSFYVDTKEPAFSSPGDLELPTIPDGRRRKFVPSKLSTKDYALCQEPWAVSSVLAWLVEITDGESDLKRQPIVDALVGLFTHKVPTMNIADAEVLGASLVQEMIHEAALVKEEEWIKFSGVRMSGVIYQLTGTGCYSSRVHDTPMAGRCYSHHCMRTLKKIDLQAQQLPPERAAEDWLTFYNIQKDDIKDVEHKEIELQNNLHEIVTSEDYFIDQLDVLLVLYRDGLAKSAQPIIALTGKQGKFINEVFGKVPAVKKANEDYLLAQLKYRQQEQGPWITGFSDIFREWIRRAKGAYIDYAYNLPNAISQMTTQIGANPLFKQFLDQVREHPRSKRLDWNTYLKAPVVRLQRYSLLLDTVRKNMRKESQAKEKANIEKAIEEIREVTRECNAKVDEMTKRTEMLELSTKLKLRPNMQDVQLNLNHLGRQIVHRGDVVRRGNNSINWVESHVILFDHFMIISKPTKNKDSSGAIKSEYFDVSKLPIPMDLLVLESADDVAVVKHTVRGIIPIGATTQVAPPKAPPTPDLRLSRTSTGQGSVNTPTTARSSSTPSMATAVSPVAVENENIMYPFRIQHLGKSEVYVLYANSAKARQEWVDAIILAKKQHAASLYQQNAEPFRLRVLADTAFAYGIDSNGGLPVHIPGTPLDRAIRSIEREHPMPAQIQPVCRSVVNCATTFTPLHTEQTMFAVGTDFGVFITDSRAPRSWYKAINATQVTQIQVLEDLNILIIIADKALIAFHLDAVVPVQGSNPSDTTKRTPQKLSGSRDVGYFAVGRIKERMLVVYKKKDGISSTFKVLEPVIKGSAAPNSTSRWGRTHFGLKKGPVDMFRDFDEFYIASETYGVNLFASSLAIASAKGIEVLTLDKKMPFSIPDLRAASVQSIANRMQGQRPLGMFRLSDQEFLLVFEEIGVYVDKHGDVSRAVVMEFVGRAKQAALHRSMYLVLVDATNGFVEVRNANNGRLRQVISGRDVRMLDDGMAAGQSTQDGVSVPPGQSRGAVKIAMQHPEIERGYVVLEMILNDGVND